MQISLTAKYLLCPLYFKARTSHDRTRHMFGHNSPTPWATELFKPSKHAEVLVSIEKKLEVCDLCFYVGDVIIGVALGFVWPPSPAGLRSRSWAFCLEPEPWAQIKNHDELELSLKFRTGAGAMAIWEADTS